MRQGLITTVVFGFAVVQSFAQTSATKPTARSIRTSVCELARHPEQFDSKQVIVHARYFTNWEWGGWLTDTRCTDKALNYLSPGAYGTPPEYANLRIVKDDGFREFEAKESVLCNGTSLLCTFDCLEADITGIFVAAKRLSKPESGMVVTSVANTKLHADEHPLLIPADVSNDLPRDTSSTAR